MYYTTFRFRIAHIQVIHKILVESNLFYSWDTYNTGLILNKIQMTKTYHGICNNTVGFRKKYDYFFNDVTET